MNLFLIPFYIFFEVTLALLYPFFGILAHLFKEPRGGARGQEGTIVLVGYWYYNNFFYRFWVWYLRKRGFDVHHIYIPMERSTFEGASKKLFRYVEQQNLHDVTLVAISSAGIVALLYLEELGGWKRTQRFVALGVPFYGSKRAHFLSFRRRIKALVPDSELIQKVRSLSVTYPERITCLRAFHDEMVPMESSRLGISQEIVIPVWGHNNLHLFSKRTYDAISLIARGK